AQGANITRKQLNAVFDALNEKFEKPVYPDYHAKVAREEAKENGEEYDEGANENFAAVSALHQSRLEIDNDNELNQEHSSEKTVNKKKSDSERTEEEQKAKQKAIDSREKRKKERQKKNQEKKKQKINKYKEQHKRKKKNIKQKSKRKLSTEEQKKTKEFLLRGGLGVELTTVNNVLNKESALRMLLRSSHNIGFFYHDDNYHQLAIK